MRAEVIEEQNHGGADVSKALSLLSFHALVWAGWLTMLLGSKSIDNGLTLVEKNCFYVEFLKADFLQ